MCGLCDNLKKKTHIEARLADLAFYEDRAKSGVYYNLDKIQMLYKIIRYEAIKQAIQECRHNGSDGQGWESDLEQVAIRIIKEGEE